MAIEFDPQWNQRENRYDTSGETVTGNYLNHDSSLSEQEMRDLCMRILRYVDNMDDAAKPKAMDKRIWDLGRRLKSDSSVVTVRKGIHQRDSKAHFLLQIPAHATARQTVYNSYHVYVAPGGVNGKLPNESYYQTNSETSYDKKGDFFRYRPTGIGVTTGGAVMALWPPQFQIHELEVPLGRPRGSSLSTGNTTALVHSSVVPPGLR
jgi:hypothetical protein